MMQHVRSILSVPAHIPSFYASALRSEAHALAFDLEDSVPPELREKARTTLQALLPTRETTSKQLFVRVADSDDVAALAPWVDAGRIDALILPKVQSLRAAQWLATIVPTIIVLETARAVLLADTLLGLPNCVGAIVGPSDLATEAGFTDRTRVPYLCNADLHAALCGVANQKPVFGVSLTLNDARSRDHMEWMREAGLSGAMCVHPCQVQRANDVWRPSDEDRQWARETLVGWKAANERCYINHTGSIVGPPTLKQARAIIDTQEEL